MSTDGSFNTGPAIPILGVGLGRLLWSHGPMGRSRQQKWGLDSTPKTLGFNKICVCEADCLLNV